MKTKNIFNLAIALCLTGSIFSQNVEGQFDAETNSQTKNQNTVIDQGNLPGSRAAAAAELINYQAVARDSGGNLIVNQAVNVDFEIRDGAGGTAVYTESQNPTTDESGVFSVQIGSVSPLSGVNWLDIDAWLQVSLNGTDVGETQIGSTATSLHSKQSAQVMIYGSGTTNAAKMVVQHSPAFPGWGIAYADVGDDIEFRAGGTTSMAIDLATGNTTTEGYVEINETTTSPAANRVYGNTSEIAYGSIDSVGGISTGYGIASVNNSATGVYEITLDLDSNPANTVVMITPFTIGFGTPEICGYETTGANTFTVRIQDASGSARDSAFSFVVYPQ